MILTFTCITTPNVLLLFLAFFSLLIAPVTFIRTFLGVKDYLHSLQTDIIEVNRLDAVLHWLALS